MPWIPGEAERTGKARKGRFNEWSKKLLQRVKQSAPKQLFTNEGKLPYLKTEHTTRKSIKITCTLVLFVAFSLICFILLNDKK